MNFLENSSLPLSTVNTRPSVVTKSNSKETLFQKVKRKLSNGFQKFSKLFSRKSNGYTSKHNFKIGRTENFYGHKEYSFPIKLDHSSELKLLLYNFLEKRITIQICRAYQERIRAINLKEVLNEAIPAIIELSEDEPYGIRGAKIIFKYAMKNPVKEEGRNNGKVLDFDYEAGKHGKDRNASGETIGAVKMCSRTVNTFEVTILLKRQHQGIKASLKSQFSKITRRKKLHVISPDFRLQKKQLYRLH